MAELEGIHLALKSPPQEVHIMSAVAQLRGDPQPHVAVYVDCQEGIRASAGTEKPKAIYWKVTRAIKQAKAALRDNGVRITTHWCPGHVDLTGNEMADIKAKEAMATSRRTQHTPTGYWRPLPVAYATIKTNLRGMVDRMLTPIGKAVAYRKRVGKDPEPKSLRATCFLHGPAARAAEVCWMRLRIGNEATAKDRARCWGRGTEQCEVCDAQDSTYHRLLTCPGNDARREVLRQKMKDLKETYSLTLGRIVGLKGISKEHQRGAFELIMKFLHDGGFPAIFIVARFRNITNIDAEEGEWDWG
jgi:ribonuclease HI